MHGLQIIKLIDDSLEDRFVKLPKGWGRGRGHKGTGRERVINCHARLRSYVLSLKEKTTKRVVYNLEDRLVGIFGKKQAESLSIFTPDWQI